MFDTVYSNEKVAFYRLLLIFRVSFKHSQILFCDKSICTFSSTSFQTLLALQLIVSQLDLFASGISSFTKEVVIVVYSTRLSSPPSSSPGKPGEPTWPSTSTTCSPGQPLSLQVRGSARAGEYRARGDDRATLSTARLSISHHRPVQRCTVVFCACAPLYLVSVMYTVAYYCTLCKHSQLVIAPRRTNTSVTQTSHSDSPQEAMFVFVDYFLSLNAYFILRCEPTRLFKDQKLEHKICCDYQVNILVNL